MAGKEKFLGTPEAVSKLGETARINRGLRFRAIRTTHHDCCYINCPRLGMIHISENGNVDAQWISSFHRDRWNADRARVLADGGGCEMRELGELLCEECWGRCDGRSSLA